MTVWSRKFDRCQKCGTTKKKHVARGLCETCYRASTEKRNRGSKRTIYGEAASKLTKEHLTNEYVNNNKSLSDIAKECTCSRQYVYKKIKEFNIPLKNKKQARDLALEKNKLFFKREDGRKIILDKIQFDEAFFTHWHPGMAYVLGVIYTDGNICPGSKIKPKRSTTSKVSRLSLYQKEPELLHKVLALMNCNAKLYFDKERKKCGNIVAGKSYHICINSDILYNQLVALGLTPDKSLTIQFPTVPQHCIRHFIRGCWDGDGSVYYSGSQIYASFVTGSKDFAKGIVASLTKEGVPKRKIYESNRSNATSYMIRFVGQRQCNKLYHYFYNQVLPIMYLQRKHDLFKSTLLADTRQETPKAPR
jgi:predicted DNA-binding protein YlxM (UPF0122 family)